MERLPRWKMSQSTRQHKVLESGSKGGGWTAGVKSQPFKGASGKHPKEVRGKLSEGQYKSQQGYIEGLKSKGGRTGGRTGIVNKSKSLENQKVVKRKKKKVDDLDSKESRKYEDLRKKQEKWKLKVGSIDRNN